MTERYCDLACRVTAMVYKGPVNRVETLSQVSCRLLESIHLFLYLLECASIRSASLVHYKAWSLLAIIPSWRGGELSHTGT
jgi:hypothetical protein